MTARGLFALVVLTLASPACLAAVCETENYFVTITEHCEDAGVFCRNVTYEGTNKRTRKSLRLKGSVVVRTCGDGVTPCAMEGYEFFSGPYRYAVTRERWLWVTRDGKTILEEKCRPE